MADFQREEKRQQSPSVIQPSRYGASPQDVETFQTAHELTELTAQDLGQYGEQLVCQWLAQRRCQVLERRWHSRFGEIDLIARGKSGQGTLRSDILAFIEVKTRSQGNWDADGLLAITRAKQKKLRTTARYFLVRHPQLSELPCRFDIALVSCQLTQPKKGLSLKMPNTQKYLTMQAYLRDAFC
ncbi:MAG: YraN family protein [Cyanobacteria bacterium J06649_4]